MSKTKIIEQPFSHRMLLFVDVLMISLVIIDLVLIAFDSLFAVKIIKEQFFTKLAPDFTYWYGNVIHQNFLLYVSSVFITIFIVELSIRWILAIFHRTYDKWFFYPIYHWYDVLGCIPTSSFRILRFIRIFVLLYRLHRWKVINLNDYVLYRQMIHYYNIVVEEVSDRVAVNLLEEVKSEIKRGEPIGSAIITDVIKPYQTKIVEWTSIHVQSGLRRHYSEHREGIQRYLKQIIKETVETNKEMSGLERIPLLGNVITDSINKAVCDITFGVIDRISSELASADRAIVIETIVKAITDIIFSANQMTSKEHQQLFNGLISDSVDLIIERVKEKKWKLAEEQEKEDSNDVFY